jgi:large repetitive protein
MRRFRIILATSVLAVVGLVVTSNASAGDFADEPCSQPNGDAYVCPAATSGSSYAVDIKLKEPWEGCTNMTVSSGAFPPGLSMDSEGRIRGVPTTAGSYPFYVTVSWSNTAPCITQPASDRKFIINVSQGVQRLFVTTNSLPEASLGQAYTAPPLSVSSGSVSSWTVAGGALPPGLSLASNGVISGTPTAPGTFTFTVQANASPNNDTRQLSIFVLAPLQLQGLTGAKAPATGWTSKSAVNQALTTGVKAVGGRGPYTFSSAGSLPPGITLDAAAGTLTGAGTTPGRFDTKIVVTDATGAKAEVPWRFTILPLLQFVKGKGLPTGTVNGVYSARIPISGKDAKTAQFAVSGKIPPGLELDDTGRLTGVLLKAGTYRIRVFAFPANGAPISQVFVIRIRA